ncbi:conserved hypothetical protein [uncultured Desulfobacterium sp.]|uniref:Lipoprotein n=1 Tax=uncultured Desulfobacterium sp. TaxID=201089 RepID=A0A445N0R0_9BACT|nr:conserved hypothetical protein [uncultured Desulfobacterium sp.]
MKNSALAVLLLLLTGCWGGHYYQENQGMVSIYLKRSDADEVYFASSLDGYKLHEADRIDNDTWEIRVPSSEEFRYFYMVDGDVYIPACRITEKDDFGSENCIFEPGT